MTRGGLHRDESAKTPGALPGPAGPGSANPSFLADMVLKGAGISKPPVFVQDCVLSVNGIRVHQERLVKDGYLIDFGDGEGEILVNSAASRRRARFTVAHELGHWILHIKSRKKGDALCYPGEAETEIERWCDAFAASLLMPARWLKGSVREAGSLASDSIVIGGIDLYWVSREAYYNRLWELFSVALIESSFDGFELGFEVWPKSVGGRCQVEQVKEFLNNKLGRRLGRRNDHSRVIGMIRVPSIGPAIVLTGEQGLEVQGEGNHHW